jgi:hypothetical protein
MTSGPHKAGHGRHVNLKLGENYEFISMHVALSHGAKEF